MPPSLRVARTDSYQQMPLRGQRADVFARHRVLTQIIARHLPPVTASLLAEPREVDGGATVEWYSDLAGKPHRLSDLTATEQEAARRLLDERIASVKRLAEQLPNIAGNFVHLFVLFSFSAVTGTLIQPFGLVDDVSIPESIGPDEKEIAADLEKSRAAILGLAYGFISRGNREGGFKEIFDGIEMDQDPAGAWAWFFERMLSWERDDHALFFAQHYIRDLFKYGERKPALKVIMRCRLINDQFRPFREDVPTAIEAAEGFGNIELAEVLKRR